MPPKTRKNLEKNEKNPIVVSEKNEKSSEKNEKSSEKNEKSGEKNEKSGEKKTSRKKKSKSKSKSKSRSRDKISTRRFKCEMFQFIDKQQDEMLVLRLITVVKHDNWACAFYQSSGESNARFGGLYGNTWLPTAGILEESEITVDD